MTPPIPAWSRRSRIWGRRSPGWERQEAFERELSQPVNTPLTGASGIRRRGEGKDPAALRRNTGQTSGTPCAPRCRFPGVVNALEEGTDSEGGYLVPDEYERTLVEALEEENVFRQLANVIRTSSGDRKDPGWWRQKGWPPGSMRKERTRRAMIPSGRYPSGLIR